MLRSELAKKSKVSTGEGLTKALSELEQCGFIRKYRNYTKTKSGFFYQLVNPFILFSHNFLKKQTIVSWQDFYKSPAFYTWRGNAFELLCLNHIPQIKNALKLELFRAETQPKKALLITLVSVTGLKKNEYSDVIQNVVTVEELLLEKESICKSVSDFCTKGLSCFSYYDWSI